LGEVSQLNNADLTFAALQGLKMALLYGPAAFRKRDCAWKAEVADMYPASHDDSSVNGFLPTAIRGELSCCRASLLTSHPAGW
jgi:hypothetical protein